MVKEKDKVISFARDCIMGPMDAALAWVEALNQLHPPFNLSYEQLLVGGVPRILALK